MWSNPTLTPQPCATAVPYLLEIPHPEGVYTSGRSHSPPWDPPNLPTPKHWKVPAPRLSPQVIPLRSLSPCDMAGLEGLPGPGCCLLPAPSQRTAFLTRPHAAVPMAASESLCFQKVLPPDVCVPHSPTSLGLFSKVTSSKGLQGPHQGLRGPHQGLLAAPAFTCWFCLFPSDQCKFHGDRDFVHLCIFPQHPEECLA